jgi:hypothetical protein
MHDANFMALARYIVTAAGLPTISQVYEEVACKCLGLIQSSVQSWQDQGLLVPGNNNTLVKCPLFQSMWDRTEIFLGNKSPKKVYILLTCFLNFRSLIGKRPRNDVEDDTEDCIIVMPPQSKKKEDDNESPTPSPTPATPTPVTNPSEVQDGAGLRSSVPVNNKPTHSTTNSPELDLSSKHNITTPQACSDKGNRPSQRSAHVGPTSSPPHSPIIPQPSQQLATKHVDGRAQNNSSMLPSTCLEVTIPEYETSKDQGERLPSIDTTTVSVGPLLAATRTQEPDPTLEPVSKRAKSKPAGQSPFQLPVDGNDRRVSFTSVDNSELQQGLPQSCRQNKRFTLDGESAAERSPPLMNTAEERQKLHCSMLRSSATRKDPITLDPRPITTVETSPRTPPHVAHGHRSFGIITPDTPATFTPVDESQPTDLRHRFAQDIQRHISYVSSNQNQPRSDNLPYRPPPVVFTDSENVIYNLPLAQLNSLTSAFDRIARIFIKSPKHSNVLGASEFFPIRAIMCSGLETFYNWYSQTSSDFSHSRLYFDLIDVTFQKERGFVISENQPDSLRLLKQYIWDTFWAESRIRGALEFFTVTVEPYLPVSNNVSPHEDRSPANRISYPTANLAPPVRREMTVPDQSPGPKCPNSWAPASPLPRTFAEKITLRMVGGI